MSTDTDPPTSARARPRGTGTRPPLQQARLSPARREGGALFGAFWRWHFYASFLVVPILLLLAATGAIYLLRFQIEPALHSEVMTVPFPTSDLPMRQLYEDQRRAVQRAYPNNTLISMTEGRDEGRSTVFSTMAADGTPHDVFVDPWTARVLGDLNPDATLSGVAIRLHGDLMAGPWGDRVIELAACWSIVMSITGYYLYFKGRAARLRTRVTRTRAAVMRHRHAVIGAVAGAGLLFLLVSGLPWTGFWGKHAQALATGQGWSLWSQDHGALSDSTSTLDKSLPHSHAVVPWGQQGAPVPTSHHTLQGGQRLVPTVDTAIAAADEQGLLHPMTVTLPSDGQGVFSVIGFAFNDPTQERTVHVDQYSGRAVATYGYDDYPALAKVVTHGIALHEGRHFGGLNLVASLAFCLGIIFMCLSGPLMWWKRRPRGSRNLGAPRGRMPLRSTPFLAVAVIALGLFLPLFGVSLLLILLVDQVIIRRLPVLSRWFATT